jgi:hypothetical protein
VADLPLLRAAWRSVDNPLQHRNDLSEDVLFMVSEMVGQAFGEQSCFTALAPLRAGWPASLTLMMLCLPSLESGERSASP